MQAMIISVTSVLMLSSSASAQSHPNELYFRYLVKDYVLQRPWSSYPEGADRKKWDCFDDRTKRTIGCALAKGALDRFRYIFRLRYLDNKTRGPRGLY
jgi:hypothetical protein